MDEYIKTLLIVCPLIFLGGFVDSVAGGGGIITIPAYMMAGLPTHVAMGTNKVVASCGAIAAIRSYLSGGKIRWFPALAAAALALPGSTLGTKAALLVAEDVLEIVLLVILPLVAIFLSLRKDFGRDEDQSGEISRPRLAAVSGLIGFVAGFYDGMIGPGTGTFMLMGFTLLLHLDLLTASGCAKVSNLASGIGSAALFLLNGKVLWSVALPAALCSILGSMAGARYALRGGSKKVRGMIFLVLGLLFIKVLSELVL